MVARDVHVAAYEGRLRVDGRLAAADKQLIAAWNRAWDKVVDEWRGASAELAQALADGTLTPARAARLQRVSNALKATRAQMDAFADATVGVATLHTPDVVSDAERLNAQLLRMQLPTVGAFTVTRVNDDALAATTRRTVGQIHSLTRPLSDLAVEAMKSSLVRAVQLGLNPKEAARDMLARANGDFAGGLVRARVIARTEILDAHRESLLASRMANADVCTGWTWMSARDKRTCPSCWSMDGREFPPDAPGPYDHQQGRCTAVPTVPSWDQLGFKVKQPSTPEYPSAKDQFDALSPADQTAIMGKRRLDMLRSGDASWDDLASKRSTSGWRDSYVPTSLEDLVSGG